MPFPAAGRPGGTARPRPPGAGRAALLARRAWRGGRESLLREGPAASGVRRGGAGRPAQGLRGRGPSRGGAGEAWGGEGAAPEGWE